MVVSARADWSLRSVLAVIRVSRHLSLASRLASLEVQRPSWESLIHQYDEHVRKLEAPNEAERMKRAAMRTEQGCEAILAEHTSMLQEARSLHAHWPASTRQHARNSATMLTTESWLLVVCCSLCGQSPVDD
jgi:hypothetical protein